MIDNLLYCIAQHIRVFIRRVHGLGAAESGFIVAPMQKVMFYVAILNCCGSPSASADRKEASFRCLERTLSGRNRDQCESHSSSKLYSRVSRSVQEEVFHREVARMKTSVLPGRKVVRGSDEKKDWSTQRVQPSAFRTRRTDTASLTSVASIKFIHVLSFIKLRTFCPSCHTSCINMFESVALMKKDQLLYLQILKKCWHRLYLSHTRINRSTTGRGVSDTQHICACL